MNTHNIYNNLKKVDLNILIADDNELKLRFNISKEKTIDELRKFLTLTAVEKMAMVPSEEVDFVFHKLLEHPVLRGEVEQILGGVLRHDPTLSGRKMRTMFSKTLSCYAPLFGTPPRENFNKAATCSVDVIR